ncbi:MAG: epimerase [Cytophagales bacterium CG18_big_fil_WC_8_21_14_2_50_42_9]|nr:MAG: epimerase [Cytophagales bacterium CG18_big_fil_WC_8_21_14_2_50_42_9]
MNQKIKIAVIGGTGKSGQYLVKELLQQGFRCKILVRNPAKVQIKSSLIEVVPGDVKDHEIVRSLVQECDAVISTLGLGQPASEYTIFSQATTNIIQAMQQYKIQRYILITGLNVDTPYDQKSVATKSATDWMYTNFPKTTADKQLEYSILVESNINWTLIRLPLIIQTDERNKINVDLADCPGDKISATDLACFLIKQLSDNTYIQQSPFIANV